MERFHIKVNLGRGRKTAYVAGGATWDGAWYTYKPTEEIVKTWKTRGGAERWLKERPTITGTVELSNPNYFLHAGRNPHAAKVYNRVRGILVSIKRHKLLDDRREYDANDLALCYELSVAEANALYTAIQMEYEA